MKFYIKMPRCVFHCGNHWQHMVLNNDWGGQTKSTEQTLTLVTLSTILILIETLIRKLEDTIKKN